MIKLKKMYIMYLSRAKCIVHIVTLWLCCAECDALLLCDHLFGALVGVLFVLTCRWSYDRGLGFLRVLRVVRP